MTDPGHPIRLDFGKLPLVEAAVRVSFAAPIKLTYAIIYALRDRLTEFRELSEPQFFEAKPGLSGPIQLGPGELPGAVFSGHTTGIALSLQNQVMVTRWKRAPGASSPEYPRYEALRTTLWGGVSGLVKVAAREIVPAVVNMSYVNFLRVPHDTPVLKKYFAPSAHVKAALAAKQLRKLEASWLETDDVDIRFNVEQVTISSDDQEVEGYRLTTAAGKRLARGADAAVELDAVHARLQAFFDDLISSTAKIEWELSVARGC